MFKVVLFALGFLSLGANAIFTRNNNHDQNLKHTLNTQCCKQKKGSICGRFNLDCCEEGCQQDWFFGPIKCKNDKHFDAQCSNNCDHICSVNHGQFCGSRIPSPGQCCSKQNCINGACKQGTTISLQGCYSDDLVSGFILFEK